MDYQNPGWQWAKIIIGILAVAGIGLIGYKVVQPSSKDSYGPYGQGVTYEVKYYGLAQVPVGGCATWQSGLKKELMNATR